MRRTVAQLDVGCAAQQLFDGFAGRRAIGRADNVVFQARFRRSLIGHYIEGRAQSRAQSVSAYDQSVLRMDGSEFSIEEAQGGDACGQWVDENGQPIIEMAGAMPSTPGALH